MKWHKSLLVQWQKYVQGPFAGAKGYAVGVDYVPAKNVVANIKYFNGKAIADKDSKVSKFYGNLEFLF